MRAAAALLALAGALALAVAMVGCEPAKGPPLGTPAAPATGVVIHVQSSFILGVEQFTLRTADGEVIVFEVTDLALDGGGLPEPHLHEHAATSQPITVEYVITAEGRNHALRYYDAP